jgi:lysophospholipase L1-like esterase
MSPESHSHGLSDVRVVPAVPPARTRRALLRSIAGLVIFCAGMIYGVLFYRDHVFPHDLLERLFVDERQPSIDPSASPWYRTRRGVFETFPQRGRVLMFGDSLTEAADWMAMLPGVGSVVNQGISADTTVGMLMRVDLANTTGAQTVAVMAGINDLRLGESAEQVFKRYQQLIEKLAAPNRCIIVQSTLFTRGVEPVNDSVRALNGALARACDGGRCRFLNLNLALAPKGELLPELTVDGLHLSGRGYSLWRDALLPALAECAR